MDHVQASPYPQSNGKLQRWHKGLKSACLYTVIRMSLRFPISLTSLRKLASLAPSRV